MTTSDSCEGERIRYEPLRFGGVLEYFGRATDSTYWEGLWEQFDFPRYHDRARRGHVAWQLRWTLLPLLAPGARILEAGCGLGDFTVGMHARGFRAEGVDYAPRIVARLREAFPYIPFFEGDVRRLHHIPEGAYDALYSPGVCEHFQEGPQDCLLEAKRILRTGGVIAVSTPCLNGFHRLLIRLGRLDVPPQGAFYQYGFSVPGMVQVLTDLGFDILMTRPYGTLLTLETHLPALRRVGRGPLAKALAMILDLAPVTRGWGYSCLWIGRKRG